MHSNPLRRACGIAVAGLFVLATGVIAQTTFAPAPPPIAAGIDVWSTPDAGARLDDFFIPNGFFCPGSLARTVDIPLKGKPIVTSPAGVLGTTDTVVERLQDAVFSGGSATVDIQVVALSLVGSAPFNVPECGQSYTVHVCLARGSADIGTMTINLDPSSNDWGTFDAFLPVTGAVTFRSGGVILGPLFDSVTVTTTAACWAREVGFGGIDYPGPVQIDQTCDGVPDGTFPGTSGFHPGWTCDGCPDEPCKCPTEHDGPHPITVPPEPKPDPCPSRDALQVLLVSEANRSLSFKIAEPCQILVDDVAISSVDGSNCTNESLVVQQDGTSRSFKVVSRSPCVLEL